jgi:hypothetical protein
MGPATEGTEGLTMLQRYWPTLRDIDDCIRTEAEVVDDAVLLAVHEPGPLRVRAANASAEETRTEDDLLQALLRPASDGSAIVVAITGDSGVGKSHMIRWLHAQLQRHPTRDQLVIVLVPKTASLRQVVELILAPLSGSSYDHLRADLARAVETLTPEAAGAMLSAALAIELERRASEWKSQLTSSGRTADTQTRERIFHALGLREVLRDGSALDHWLGAVLLRIVTRTLVGGSEAESGALRRFIPSDFELPNAWDSTQAGQATQRYLQRLESNEGAARTTAADVLQDVLDPALRTVFRFSEALGQRTIEEIVDDIRRRLLGEGKELVLLIEDFAALAGIQQPLLNLMIAESDHQGRRVRAPLRTALAVTDGFLPSRQTILTRAKHEWIIPSAGLSEDDVIRRFTELAGRYLNAARWGITALREQYRNDSQHGLYGWVKSFHVNLGEPEQNQFQAFGKSNAGFPLFPLSRPAIASLCRRELRSGSNLSFNPRAFINHVLRDTLLQRPLFVSGQFPPAHFKNAVLPANVEIALRPLGYSSEVRERLAPAIVHWAGDPADLHESPQVNEGVFTAFGLPWPFSGTPVSTTSPVPSPSPSPPPPGTPDLKGILDKWASGQLPQKPASHVRNVLAAALNDRMDWNSLRMRALPILNTAIWLPFAPTGNPNNEPILRVAKEARPVSADTRKGIAALDIWYANKKSWDYPGAEEDYAIAQQLLDSLETQARDWASKVAVREAAAVARVLHRQSLMLGVSRKAEPTRPRAGELFAPPPETPVVLPKEESSPAGLVARALLRAKGSRAELQGLLLDDIACYQGIGKQPYAIDSQRLLTAWKQAELEDDFRQIRVDAPAARESAQDLGILRLPALLARYASATESALAILRRTIGEEFKPDFALQLRTQIGRSHKMGLFPGDRFVLAEVERALDLLASEDAVSLLDRALPFKAPSPDSEPQAQLSAWANLDIPLMARLSNALVLLERLLAAIEREAAAQLSATSKLTAQFEELQARLHAVGELA